MNINTLTLTALIYLLHCICANDSLQMMSLKSNFFPLPQEKACHCLSLWKTGRLSPDPSLLWPCLLHQVGQEVNVRVYSIVRYNDNYYSKRQKHVFLCCVSCCFPQCALFKQPIHILSCSVHFNYSHHPEDSHHQRLSQHLWLQSCTHIRDCVYDHSTECPAALALSGIKQPVDCWLPN